MSNYIPGGQKKVKIFKKRETELIHAIKHEFNNEKIIKAVEKLRLAKLNCGGLSEKVYDKWHSYTVDDLINIYKKRA